MLEIIYLHLFLKLGFGLYPFFLTVNPLDLLSETECCVGCLRFGGNGTQIYMFLNTDIPFLRVKYL